MSEDFEFIHNNLRDIKEHTGIDILHSKGIVIHGRTYPAMDKTLYSIGDEIGVNATIPMENGTIIHVSGLNRRSDVVDQRPHSKDYGNVWLSKGYEGGIQHKVPVAYTNRADRGGYKFEYGPYAYDSEATVPTGHFWTPEDADPDEINKVIKTWSQLPFKNRNMDIPPSHPGHWHFSEDQQKEWEKTGPHHSVFNSGFPVQKPHEITIMADPGKNFRMQKYDINTEQLRNLLE